MYLERTLEQQSISDAARTLAERSWPLDQVSAALNDDALPPETWTLSADMGWCHLLAAEADGGLGLTTVEAGAVAEEAGRALFPGPLIEAQALALLPAIDPASTTLAQFHLTDVTMDGDRLTGSAELVPYADRCMSVVVLADKELWIVSTTASGVAIEHQPGVDIVSRPCRVTFTDSEAERVGGATEAAAVEAVVHCLTASRLLGLIESSIEIASTYALERQQFGRPIGSFQAVQQLLADMKKAAIATRSVCYASQAALADGQGDAPRWARIAKAYASRAARKVTEGAIQVHGGIGFTTEVHAHLFLKHALTLQAAWGDEAEHERWLANDLASN